MHQPETTAPARDRAVGALVGLAAGDAAGTTVEFRSPGTFTPVTDMVGGGPFALPAGAWTDDTSMALCLAESLLDTAPTDDEPMDLADQCRRYLAWQTDGYLSSTGRCFDIGNTTARALRRFARTGRPTDDDVDQEAAANGSLMRLAPVPIRWHRDPGIAAERSAESSRTTHGADRPVDACRVLGAMVAALISGTAFDEVVSPDFWQWGPLHPEIRAVVDGSWRDKEPPAIRGRGYCVDALEAAIWAVAGATDFADAVLRATNLGDDADTTAAIAGQLAGARWGASAIPEAWRDRLVMGDRIESLAGRLFDAGEVGDATRTAAWEHDGPVHAYRVDATLLAGEYPSSITGEAAAEAKLALLVDAGVRTFVDLTEPGELDPYQARLDRVAAERGLELRRVSHPIPDASVIHDDAYEPILESIAQGRHRGVVYVHCWGGIGRTGTVVGCALAALGLDADDIFFYLDHLRSGSRKRGRPAPETEIQREVIRRWAAVSGLLSERVPLSTDDLLAAIADEFSVEVSAVLAILPEPIRAVEIDDWRR